MPVTSTSGFTVGQKIALGYGRTFETATVTAVGQPGTAAGAGTSAVRLPDGADPDSNCTDFTTSSDPTPGGANQP